MKRTLLITLLVMSGFRAEAQCLSVSSFREDRDDYSGMDATTRRLAPDGEPCAVVKISTDLTGMSFDAGTDCIVDAVYTKPGVWLYLPPTARYITISHKVSGTLFRWNFPISMESGRTYRLVLKAELPKKEPAPRTYRAPKPKPVRPPFEVEGFSSHFIQTHLGVEISEGSAYSAVFGLSYCFMPKRWGFYTSIDISTDACVAVFAGPSVRMLDSSSSVDWQLYAGPGYVPYSGIGADLGSRFGWNTDKVLSRYDFSVGCQYWGKGSFVPYVGMGAKISCYSLAIVLSLVICAAAM